MFLLRIFVYLPSKVQLMFFLHINYINLLTNYLINSSKKMKRLLFFLMATIFAIQGWSQTATNQTSTDTICDPIMVLPHTENFDTYGVAAGSFLPCWSRPVLNSTTPFPSIHTTNHSSPASIKFQSASAAEPTYVVTPRFIDDISQLRVKFWLKAESTSSSGVMEVGVMSDPTDVSSFELVGTVNPSSTDWTEYEFLFNATTLTGPNNYIAFKHVTVSSVYYYWLDDVTVDYIPSCYMPSNILVSNTTTTSADITWAPAHDTDYAWWLYYKENSSTDFDSVYISGSPIYSFFALTANTEYDIYVRTDCGTEISEPSDMISFRTLCEPIAILPYTENFDSYGVVAGSFLPCWSRPVLNTTTPFPSIHTTNNSAPASIKFQSSSASAPTYVITPQFADDINLLRVKFWLKREGANSGTMEIGLVSDPNDISSFELVGVIDPPTNDWIEYEYLFSGTDITGPNNCIAFRHITNLSNWYYWLDDVTVDYIPSCSKPGSIDAENITTTSADITWAPAHDTDYAWWLYYKENSSTDFDSVYISGSPIYSFFALTANTEYDIYVRTDCGTEISEPSDMISFRTLCEPIAILPYTENFDSYGVVAGSFLPCWSRPVLNTTTPFPSIHTTNNSAPASIKFQSSSASAPTYVITPQFADDINLLRVKFFLKREGANSGTMEVGVMSDPNDLTSFEIGRAHV